MSEVADTLRSVLQCTPDRAKCLHGRIDGVRHRRTTGIDRFLHQALTLGIGWVLAQPKQVAEVDRIAVGIPIEVEPAGEPDRIFLGITPDRRMRLRPQRCKRLRLCPLAASTRSCLIVQSTPKPGRVFAGGSAVPSARTEDALDERGAREPKVLGHFVEDPAERAHAQRLVTRVRHVVLVIPVRAARQYLSLATATKAPSGTPKT